MQASELVPRDRELPRLELRSGVPGGDSFESPRVARMGPGSSGEHLGECGIAHSCARSQHVAAPVDCELTLDGEEELQAAGIPSTWQLDDQEVHAADFYDHDYD